MDTFNEKTVADELYGKFITPTSTPNKKRNQIYFDVILNMKIPKGYDEMILKEQRLKMLKELKKEMEYFQIGLPMKYSAYRFRIDDDFNALIYREYIDQDDLYKIHSFLSKWIAFQKKCKKYGTAHDKLDEDIKEMERELSPELNMRGINVKIERTNCLRIQREDNWTLTSKNTLESVINHFIRGQNWRKFNGYVGVSLGDVRLTLNELNEIYHWAVQNGL